MLESDWASSKWTVMWKSIWTLMDWKWTTLKFAINLNSLVLTWRTVNSWSRFWPFSWLWANFWQCYLKWSHYYSPSLIGQPIRCRLLTWVNVGVVPVILPRNSFSGNICLSGSISSVFHIFGCRFSSWRKTPNAELF